MTKPQPLHVANAHVYNGNVENSYDARDLYTTDVVVAERPKDALTVDLSGYTIFPGLINAHDHLEMNHYPRTKYRERYDNAHQWGEDVNAHLNESPFKELRAYPLEDRCFIGGLKNLLCGATTVVHHNPPHKCLFKRDFPVRVVKKYGWTHSLHFSTDEEVVTSYRSTPPDVPWFIHLAEGTDKIAAGEYQRLKALGCVGKNTVIVHGVGLTDEDIADAAPRVRGLVWCPSTNVYLLGKTSKISLWKEYGGILAIGSDSRLTAYGDLLVEIRPDADAEEGNAAVYNVVPLSYSDDPIRFCTKDAPKVTDLNIVGHLRIGAQADWFIVPDGEDRRRDIPLVVRGGVPQIGDPEVMAMFPHVETVAARLDGREKRMNITLARQVARCSLKEAGLELLEDPLQSTRSRLWRRP